MGLMTKAPRGTQDILPQDTAAWQRLERTMLETAAAYGFHEIRTPVFEHTELFSRAVGDTTDVVQKEMYTFDDRGGRSITLRPEGTAGAARAVLEHGLLAGALPVKVAYLITCYRYEKPQAGRLREFHQFGLECYGPASPMADAELIGAADGVLRAIGVQGTQLRLNSLGCPACRAAYREALTAYLAARRDRLCPNCVRRMEANPLRALDCKEPGCAEACADAPVITDYLCDDCAAHFAAVRAALDEAGVAYRLTPRMVRGLDYYTRTVFEFAAAAPEGELVVCGGGRYDNLCAELGGPSTPALGFAMGLERLLLILRAQGVEPAAAPPCDLFFIPLGDDEARRCFRLAQGLREAGIRAEQDLMGRPLKAQLRYADKRGARFTLVVGDAEMAAGTAALRDMRTGETASVPLDGGLREFVQKRLDDETQGGRR